MVARAGSDVQGARIHPKQHHPFPHRQNFTSTGTNIATNTAQSWQHQQWHHSPQWHDWMGGATLPPHTITNPLHADRFSSAAHNCFITIIICERGVIEQLRSRMLKVTSSRDMSICHVHEQSRKLHQSQAQIVDKHWPTHTTAHPRGLIAFFNKA